MKINEIDYHHKINELRKLINVYEGVFDYEDDRNVTYDVSGLEGEIEEGKKLVYQYSDIIERTEKCNCEGNKNNKYLDEKPK